MGGPHSRLRTLGRLRGSMKGLAVVYRRTLEVSLHDQADEADQDQDEHRRGSDQRNRQDRAPDLPFARLLQVILLDRHAFEKFGVTDFIPPNVRPRPPNRLVPQAISGRPFQIIDRRYQSQFQPVVYELKKRRERKNLP
jgi:hypothetical protein